MKRAGVSVVIMMAASNDLVYFLVRRVQICDCLRFRLPPRCEAS